MRLFFVLLLGFLTACETIGPVAPAGPAPSFKVNPNPNAAVSAYERVAARIVPVATSLCRKENPGASRNHCDFVVALDTKDRSGPNAYQTIGRDGRPIIAFNVAMLATVENDDEIAFILGHEAGHQIGNHILKTQATANLGATILGAIFSQQGATSQQVEDAANIGGLLGSRVYSKDHELDADVIGTYIAHTAGYNPLVGAQSFRRFSGGGGFLSTHPSSPQRIITVQQTLERIRAGQPLRR